MIPKAAIWMVIALVLFTVFRQFDTRQSRGPEMPYSQFMEEARQGRIKSAMVEGRTVRAITSDERQVVINTPQDLWMVSDLMKYGVRVSAKAEEEPSVLMSIFVSWFPMLLLIGVWVFFYAPDARRRQRWCVLLWQVACAYAGRKHQCRDLC